MNQRQLQTKGIEATRVLNNPTISDAFNRLRKNIHSKWESTEAKDNQDRETLYLQLICLKSVEKQLQLFIDEGKRATKRLEET